MDEVIIGLYKEVLVREAAVEPGEPGRSRLELAVDLVQPQPNLVLGSFDQYRQPDRVLSN